MQRQWSAEDKVKIVLAALKGDMTMAEISSKFEVHNTQINRWKRQVLEGMKEILSQGKVAKGHADQELVKELYQQIGQLKVENDWLQKKSELFIR